MAATGIKFETAEGYVLAAIWYDAEKHVMRGKARIVDMRPQVPHTRYADIYVPLKQVQKEIALALSDRVGWGWGSVVKAAKGIAKRVGKNTIIGLVKKIGDEASSYAGAIYPPLGVTYAAIKKANDMLSAAKRGSAVAQAKVKKIRTMAERGNLAYAKAANVLIVLNEAAKKFDVDEWVLSQVSGWVYNKPYRQLLVNSPQTTRGLYSAGLD